MYRPERRRIERFDLKLPATLVWTGTGKENESIELKTSNICGNGLFFKTNKPLSVGTAVKLAIILPLEKFKNVKYKKSHIYASGSVIRKDQRGMAIRLDKKYKILPS